MNPDYYLAFTWQLLGHGGKFIVPLTEVRLVGAP